MIINYQKGKKGLSTSSSSEYTNTSNKENTKLNLENIELKTWYNANSSNVDGATLRLFNVVWNEIIKEYYSNAVLSKYTIYDKDDYGRYIVGVAFTKSSVSENLTYNWCCTWVKDINNLNKIGYWKTNPTAVSYIYNNSTYSWGTPLPDSL